MTIRKKNIFVNIAVNVCCLLLFPPFLIFLSYLGSAEISFVNEEEEKTQEKEKKNDTFI